MKPTFSPLRLLVGLFLSMSIYSLAQAQSKLPTGTAAIVNGISISEAAIDEAVKANIARGQQETPQLRKLVIESFINRELLAQDAAKQGLDKTAEARQQLNQARQNVLIELALGDNRQKHPVTEASVRAEYDRQIAALGNTSTLQEYKLSIIVVPTESEAKTVSAALKRGESFSKLAQEKSIDPSKAKGGDLGWVLPNQISPTIANTISSLGKNINLTAPIQVGPSWVIVKVEDKRRYKVPTFSESQAAIRNSLLQKVQLEYLASLKSSAKISE
jgi:peptidyl-prolyl cis-trans isomerase C